jgi:hypothetical protein
MSVWVLTYEYVDDGSHTVTVFSTETDAFAQAASEIQDVIADSWNMNDLDQADAAKTINGFIAANNYKKAVRYWNDCSENVDSNYPQYWTVSEQDPARTPSLPTIFDASYFTALLDDEEEEDASTQTPSDGLEDGDGFVTSTPGATCRGTHAEWNEYATADRRDGTYLCQQCRMFRQVFGGIKKP